MIGLYGRAIEFDKIRDYKNARNDLKKRWELFLESNWQRPSHCSSYPLFSTNAHQFPNTVSSTLIFPGTDSLDLHFYNSSSLQLPGEAGNLRSSSIGQLSIIQLPDKPLLLTSYFNSSVFGCCFILLGQINKKLTEKMQNQKQCHNRL